MLERCHDAIMRYLYCLLLLLLLLIVDIRKNAFCFVVLRQRLFCSTYCGVCGGMYFILVLGQSLHNTCLHFFARDRWHICLYDHVRYGSTRRGNNIVDSACSDGRTGIDRGIRRREMSAVRRLWWFRARVSTIISVFACDCCAEHMLYLLLIFTAVIYSIDIPFTDFRCRCFGDDTW